MSNGVVLLTNDACRRATLASSPACVTGWGPEYLQRQGRTRAARVDGVEDQWTITGELPAAEVFNLWSLPRHNLTGLATVRFRAWDGPGQTGALTYDSGPVSPGRLIPWAEIVWGITPWGGSYEDSTGLSVTPYWRLESQAVVRSFKIDIDDPNNPAGYLQIGRLLFGAALESETGPAVDGFQWAWIDTAESATTGAGSPVTEAGAQYRVCTLRLPVSSEAERAAWGRALRQAGKGADLLLVTFPWASAGSQMAADFTMLCRITDLPQYQPRAAIRWQASYTFREV